MLMHSRRTPETMQIDPWYDDVVSEVKRTLGLQKIHRRVSGTNHMTPVVAKTAEHNLALLRAR